MPTREYTEEEKKEAKEAGERLKAECEHSTYAGECLLDNTMCCYEEQEKCSEYFPKFPKDKIKNKNFRKDVKRK